MNAASAAAHVAPQGLAQVPMHGPGPGHVTAQAHTQVNPQPSAVPAIALRQRVARAAADLGTGVAAGAAAQRSGFVPMLLLALGMVGWLGFQSVQLLAERQQLAAAQLALEVPVQGAAKVRAALDAVATATAKLAGEGNANARAIVEQLRQRGITINAPAALAKPP